MLENNHETFIVSKDTKIPGTNYIIKKGESFTFVDESEQMTEENTIYCDGQEAKALNVLQQLFGNSDLVFRGKHIWKFSSDKSHEDALKRLNDYEKEHNLDLEYSSESVLREGSDWSRIEKELLKVGLKFNKYGIWFNNRDFELTRMYLSDEYTVLTFYNDKGFKSLFNGMEFPLLIVAEYAYPIKDINKERPDDIQLFDDIMDGYNYASHLDSDAHEYSRHQNKNEFWFAKKQICEDKKVSNMNIEIKEECKIPGTNIILEKNDKIQIML